MRTLFMRNRKHRGQYSKIRIAECAERTCGVKKGWPAAPPTLRFAALTPLRPAAPAHTTPARAGGIASQQAARQVGARKGRARPGEAGDAPAVAAEVLAIVPSPAYTLTVP